MSNSKSLKRQFIHSFIAIILLSLLCTFITYGIMLLLMLNRVIFPADYYEQKVPAITQYMNNHKAEIVLKKHKSLLEKHIPLSGIKYAILDQNNKISYGTIPKLSKRDMVNIKAGEYQDIDTSVQNNVTKYIYLKTNRGTAIAILKYSIEPSMRDPRFNFLVSTQFVLFIPFVFIILFTYIIAVRFSKKLNRPIKDLITAAQKVKKQELDFQLTYDVDNELGSLVDAFNDMKNELSLSLNRQWEVEEERKEMVSAVAHDLRTPLTIIKGHVDVLMDSGIDNKERVFKYLDTINYNTERVTKLIEDMNKLTQLEREDFSISLQEINLESFIKSCKENYSSLCRNKNISFNISLRFDEQDEPTIYFDQNRILQVLDNIISNSLRFTPENGLIELGIIIKEDQIHFTIKDTGKGFDSVDTKKIFTKFYQEDKSRSDQKLHFGLGLYTAKYIIRSHGGDIYASNNDNGGACVTFYILISK